MRLRYWVLTLADLMVIAHIIYLSLLVAYHHEKDPQKNPFLWMFSERVQAAFYITTNVIPIVLSSVLYIGIFWLSTRLLFLWLLVMVLLWHIPAILVFHILCLDRGVEANIRKLRILSPCLWLCIWMLLMINVFTFYSELKKFKKHPQFLRTNVVLVKKMTQLKANQPGKLLVSVDSDVQ
ncbi:uncharacterized protein LOC119082411 [Bradysia coprophila]|uniref:uncharacterized protein LOC119082411 n=1 Tax=Bradysia coprophila TaxID=38358 RepID=UPI00187DC4E4|nr:uncharacterized protein LOC119082411 [Bradysia coprophila]